MVYERNFLRGNLEYILLTKCLPFSNGGSFFPNVAERFFGRKVRKDSAKCAKEISCMIAQNRLNAAQHLVISLRALRFLALFACQM